MRIGKSSAFWNFFGIFYILQVATTQKLQRFTVNGCVVICGVTAVLSRFMSFNNVCNRLRWSGSFMFYSIWNSRWSWKMETLVCTQSPTHKCAHIWREAKNILPHWLQFFAQLLRPFIRVLQCLKGAFVQFA